jgi:hypothetical protein
MQIFTLYDPPVVMLNQVKGEHTFPVEQHHKISSGLIKPVVIYEFRVKGHIVGGISFLISALKCPEMPRPRNR